MIMCPECFYSTKKIYCDEEKWYCSWMDCLLIVCSNCTYSAHYQDKSGSYVSYKHMCPGIFRDFTPNCCPLNEGYVEVTA